MTIIYYIGTKDKDTKDYKLTDEFAKQTITDEFIREYPLGFTITEGTGYYKHTSGGTVIENTYIVTVLHSIKASYNLIERLKRKLNQECIAVQVIKDITMFI